MNDEMRDLLAKASVVAEGPASRMDPNKTAQLKPGAVEPRSTGTALRDRMETRFLSAHTPGEISRALAWAHSEYSKARKRRSSELTPDQRHYWVVVASQGKEYRDVALEHGLNEKTVWKMRSDAGYEPRKGLPKVA